MQFSHIAVRLKRGGYTFLEFPAKLDSSNCNSVANKSEFLQQNGHYITALTDTFTRL